MDLTYDIAANRVTGTTFNVARLSINRKRLDLDLIKVPRVQIDGEEVVVEETKDPLLTAHDQFWLIRADKKWRLSREDPSESLKGPIRYGPFKEVFYHHRPTLVYGTMGTPEENAWAIAKARYDAETFWYRGNGVLEVVADRDFDATTKRGGSVILYGNAETNGDWATLLRESPVQVRRGVVQVGAREFREDGLACLFIRPKAKSPFTLVGAVSGTDLTGMRLTDRMPYFVSGVHYPDVTVAGIEVLRDGHGKPATEAERRGIRVVGFFGNDWSVEGGEFAIP